MKHLSIVLASVAVLAAGCGDEEQTAARAPATTPEPAATTPAETPEPADTPEPAKGGCRTGAVEITITGGEGVPCKLAKRIYGAYVNGDPVPKGWECDVRACTNIASEDVRDFTWK